MVKVKICGKEYDMNCSVLTIANYCNIFGMEANFGKDFSEASDYYDKLVKCYELKKEVKDGKEKVVSAKIRDEDKYNAINYSSNLIVLATKLAYTFIRECDNTFMPYDEWASSLTNVLDDISWIKEVVGIASNVFRRSLSQQNQK